MAYAIMAFMATAYVVTAYIATTLYSYGLYSYGLYVYSPKWLRPSRVTADIVMAVPCDLQLAQQLFCMKTFRAYLLPYTVTT